MLYYYYNYIYNSLYCILISGVLGAMQSVTHTPTPPGTPMRMCTHLRLSARIMHASARNVQQRPGRA